MLEGKRILIVEDEPLIAFDLEVAVKVHSGSVIGPAYSIVEAMSFAEHEQLQGAILDLNLKGSIATSVLKCLLRRGIPCVVHTGQLTTDLDDLRVPIINKPALPEAVIAALLGEMAKPGHS